MKLSQMTTCPAARPFLLQDPAVAIDWPWRLGACTQLCKVPTMLGSQCRARQSTGAVWNHVFRNVLVQVQVHHYDNEHSPGISLQICAVDGKFAI